MHIQIQEEVLTWSKRRFPWNHINHPNRRDWSRWAWAERQVCSRRSTITKQLRQEEPRRSQGGDSETGGPFLGATENHREV